MPERPILPLPGPNPIAVPRGHGGGEKLRLPPRNRQGQKFGPVFDRLETMLSRQDGPLQLRNDPSSLAPDRVIVFEIAGTVANFLKAVARVPGLEFIAEYEGEFPADEDFAVKDKRKGKDGQDRTDKVVSSRFYLAMPDVRALQELLRLWDRWTKGQALGDGFAPFAHLFEQLRTLRPWGPQDRIPEETIMFWREEAARQPGQSVRTEVELWYRGNENRRRQASNNFAQAVVAAGGRMVHEAVIPDIAYHGALVDIPADAIQDLIERREISLALADDVMFLRPQSVLRAPLEVEPDTDALAGAGGAPAAGDPIAALLDGVPVQAHQLLANRIVLDDPDDVQARATVSRRIHGTAMASLIVHGDRNEGGAVLTRPLYVRPLMITSDAGHEHTETDRLLIDTLYRAVIRIKGSEAEAPAAPSVFLINISLGDTRRPFTRMISPLARLLDFLSVKYNLLFLVSAGNISTPLDIPDFANWAAFEGALPDDRERAVLAAVAAAKHERTILSPAESLNALTIGAQHADSVTARMAGAVSLDPFPDSTLPNVSSALGLGHRRMIKPELLFPGGREYLRMVAAGGGGVRVSVAAPQRLFGLRAAAPDPTGVGRLDYTALSDGTSSATALGTRAAHHIFDALMDREGGSRLADMDRRFYAVVVKCLMVHTARWNDNHELLKEICGPEDKKRHVERAENSCRFIGFGIPLVGDALACAPNRATLVGFGAIPPENAQSYRIPLPPCLERVTDPRSLTISLAWFSPVRPGHQSYRAIRLEASPVHEAIQVLGVDRLRAQPADPSVKRGSVFHERFHGTSAVPFIDDGHLVLQVWSREDAGGIGSDPIPYGIAITIEAEAGLPVYDEIEQRLRVQPRAVA